MRRTLFATAGGAAMFLSGAALADSIDPSTYSTTLAVGESVTISKTVTVSAGRPTAAKADIFFLTDTTGSMGGTINTVKTGFNTIAAAIPGDIAYGAGEFKDIGDAFVYKKNQDITTSLPAVQTAINGWVASGGGDTPEQGLYALRQVATTTTWRSGAERIAVIAGDAPSHDVAHPPTVDGTTVANTAADLTAAGVTVISVDVGSLNSFGQFNGGGSIYANGASGSYFTGFGAGIIADIIAAIGTAFDEYTTVTLQVVGATGVSVDFTPVSHVGDYDRSVERTFGFDVTFTGLTPGVHNFTINALVDGGVIATETDTITVAGVPEPATWAMMLVGFAGIGFAARRRARQEAAAA